MVRPRVKPVNLLGRSGLHTDAMMSSGPNTRRDPGRALLFVGLSLVATAAVSGCNSQPPSVKPTRSPARPAVSIDATWISSDGRWTFAGQIDPQGDPTDVVLEVGPGPANLRNFDARLPVAQGLVDPGPLTITTSDLPDIAEICVRFSATNSAGTSVSTPLCVPHDLPTPAVPSIPAVGIDETVTFSAGQWTFTGHADPGHAEADVVLEIGSGPATAPQFVTTVPVTQKLTDAARLSIATAEIPDGPEICVRFTATNHLGTTSTAPVCFTRAAPTPSGS